ncbi:MAG TPA: polysaccharide lyase family protein, partial [Opitutales bacterium]|nr:polysaccharide lyase family protein [Opitutales bacterium]
CVFEHQPAYSATTITEARFCVKLADMFDWMLVDDTPHRNKLYPKEARENKYDYTVVQFDHPAYGWASTTKDVGFFLLNPSLEYMSGGPTKVEFLCHRDTNAVAAPTVLNYWRSSHYGGAGVSVAAGEHWTKVVGPFMLYCNSGGDPQQLYKDAQQQQAKEAAQWPYAWVDGIDYPHKEQRATVSGQLVLNDPVMPSAKMSHLMVGLAHPDYQNPGAFGGPQTVTWQTDAKNYEFWVRGNDDGTFAIPNVRPGTYTLHAFANGVLGEYAQANVTVESGQPLDLGKINWTPVRRGQQVWEIGIPNRNGSEFLKGDDFFHDGMQIQYAQLFPNDVTFTIGQSDYRKDWYYEQVPHANEAALAAAARGPARLPGETPPAVPAGTARGAGSGRGGAPGFARGPAPTGNATPWNIVFDLPAGAKGTATLRAAFSGTGVRAVDVKVNGESVGQLGPLPQDSTLSNLGNGIQGIWHENELAFDASKLKPGKNTLTLTVPAGALTAGVIYDYLRLELDQNAVLPAAQ